MRKTQASARSRTAALVLIAAIAAAASGLAGCESDQPTYKPATTKTRSTKSPAKWDSSSGAERPQSLPHRA
jgi:hypothetical protein